MTARIVKEQAARWQVIVPWQKGEQIAEVVAVDITTVGTEIGIKMIGSPHRITFPLERAKLFLSALQEAINTTEPPSA